MNKAGKNTLFHKHLTRQTSKSEQEEIERLLQTDFEKEAFDQIEEIWDAAEDVDFDLQANTDDQWNQLLSSINAEPKVRSLNVRWLRAVAAILIVGLIGAVVWLNGFGAGGPAIAAAYETTSGERNSFDLLDGSAISLNAASVLEVVKGFNEKDRQLLLEGEAYFKVASDKNKPFSIQTGAITTTVLGTAFNLSAYADDPEIKIDVLEGKVRFTHENGKEHVLTVGQAARYNKETQTLSIAEYDEQATAWEKGTLVFDDTPLSEVISTLRRTFDIQIQLDKSRSNLPYSSTFDNKSSTEILQIIKETLDLQMRTEENLIILY